MLDNKPFATEAKRRGAREDLHNLREEADNMPRDAGGRRQFTVDFRIRAVQLMLRCKSNASETGRELGISHEILRQWKVAYDAGRLRLDNAVAVSSIREPKPQPESLEQRIIKRREQLARNVSLALFGLEREQQALADFEEKVRAFTQLEEIL